jgi:hypothetical protein
MQSLRLLFLTSFVLVFISLNVIAIEVTLKNGKRLEGVLLFEDDMTIRIMDQSGVQYSLKKSNLDLQTIERLKEMKNNHPQSNQPSVISEEPSTSEARPEQKTSSKIYNNDDIRGLRNFTEPGTVKQDSEAKEEKHDKDKSKTEARKNIAQQDSKVREEQRWREEHQKLKDVIAELETNYEQAQFECTRSGGHNTTEILMDVDSKRFVWVKNTNCQKEDSLREALDEARDNIFYFEQNARIQGLNLDWYQENQ